MKSLILCLSLACLPLLAAGQVLPRYRAISLGAGSNMHSISSGGDALFTNDNGRSVIFNPGSGTHTFPSFVWAIGLANNGDAWCYDYQDKTYLYHRTTGTYTEYIHPFGGGMARLTGANSSGRAVGQLDAITGLGFPVRWLTPTAGELLMDSSGVNPAVYVQAISESGYALGSDGPNNGCIWAPGTTTALVVRPNNRRVGVSAMAANGWISATRKDGVLGGSVPLEAYVIDAAGNVLHRIDPYAGRSISLWNVDASGWVSGASLLHNGTRMTARAIIWSANTGMVELQNQVDNPPPGMELEYALRSESGAILAQGPIFNGLHRQMYYLEPVPEPSSFVVLSASLVIFLRRRQRKT